MQIAHNKRFLAAGALLLLLAVVGLYFIFQNASSGVVAHDKYTQSNEPPGHGIAGNASTDKDSFDTTITYTERVLNRAK